MKIELVNTYISIYLSIYLTLVCQCILQEENSQFKPVEIRLKIDPARAVGLVNIYIYIYTYIYTYLSIVGMSTRLREEKHWIQAY